MRAGGSKAKGNSFESVVMREMRKLFPQSHRSMGSGCSNDKDDKGDVVAGPYMIECKFHKSFTQKELQGYWLKINREAQAAQKEPLLVYKENNKEPMVMLYINCMVDDRRAIMYFSEFIDELNEEDEILGKAK
jgi:hypothetical protein